MKFYKTAFLFLSCVAVDCAMAQAQAPSVTIDPQRHGNLAAAQSDVIQAYTRITEAQRDNNSHLGGHAQRAKELLSQANQEIALSADQADANGGVPSQPEQTPPRTSSAESASPQATNLSGNWTIYAYNANQPGSSLKQVQLSQDGNILSGTFRGPHQKGHLQGWVNGTHVEFSTDTHDVLTFRGEITPDGMSGMYGIHGEHAPWKAQRN